MSKILQKATEIMILAHGDQKRKTDGSPYIIHTIMVALKLSQAGFSDEIVAAGLTHDVLEDTDFPEEKLKQELGNETWQIVKDLSEDKSLEWEDRKIKYIQTIKNSSLGAKAVSICDKIHNLENLIDTHQALGSKIWNKFNRGKEKKMWFEKEMLEMFENNWSHPLIKDYQKLIQQVEKLD